MPQIPVNSSNIATFSWVGKLDLYQRKFTFDASSTTYNGSGIQNIVGISFSLVDSAGISLITETWTPPQIIPSVSQTYILDLSSSPINFLFQNYQIIGYIQDAGGAIYQTAPILVTVCEPPQICESGYVPGMFQITPDCINNILTVSEITLLIYNNAAPLNGMVTKSGTLYYPTGTLAPVTFTNTPFTNNQVYTGQYQVSCTTVATYDLGNDISLLVTYLTNQQFPVTCGGFLGDITCCLTNQYNTYLSNCNNSIGAYALQQYNSVTPLILNGLLKEINGQDASAEAAQIKQMLNCNCGSSSVSQNEITPVNPAVNSIVLMGVGGTTIPAATITGNTKTYYIASNSYVVGKGNTGDLAFTITQNTSVANVVTYYITFNYDTMAGYILTAIAADPTLINQLNSLITNAGGGSLVGLNGQCIINLSQASYAVTQAVNGSTLISYIVINGVVHMAPTNLYANNTVAVAAWLNSLTLGTFTAVLVGNNLTIQSVNNPNTISTISFTNPNVVLMFSATNATLVQVLQAIINYLCGITALQVNLAANLSLCTFNYMGQIVTTNYPATLSQGNFNAGVASAICNIVAQIETLTGVTCTQLRAIFVDNPASQFSGGVTRLFGIDQNGNCVAFTLDQIGLGVMQSATTYANVLAAFCAINCSTPVTCPDISAISLNMVGANIGFYGLTWATSTTATQTVTLQYRLTGTLTWITATNVLQIAANGNIIGTTPFQISGLSQGTSYDVQVKNNCGGVGQIQTITTPTGSVYTGSYLLYTNTYLICGQAPVTLYSSQPFASGVTMYTNIGLTTPVTGYTYITTNGQNIFGLNSSTGVVGINTGSSCASGTAGVYGLSNSSAPTICSASPVTLYTNGVFTVGGTLYIDSGLTMPQTGYSYVLNKSNNHIYNVNSGTGGIISDTGVLCTGTAVLTFSFVNAGGSFLQFEATLSRAVDANITISQLFADGFTDGACTNDIASAQKNTNMVIAAGFTGVGAPPDSTTGTWASALHYREYNLIINGVSHLNGDVISVGSYLVTLVVPGCI